MKALNTYFIDFYEFFRDKKPVNAPCTCSQARDKWNPFICILFNTKV